MIDVEEDISEFQFACAQLHVHLVEVDVALEEAAEATLEDKLDHALGEGCCPI